MTAEKMQEKPTTVGAFGEYTVASTDDTWAMFYAGEQVFGGDACCRLHGLQAGMASIAMLVAEEADA